MKEGRASVTADNSGRRRMIGAVYTLSRAHSCYHQRQPVFVRAHPALYLCQSHEQRGKTDAFLIFLTPANANEGRGREGFNGQS